MEKNLNELKTRLTNVNYSNLNAILSSLLSEITDEDFSTDILSSMIFYLEDMKKSKQLKLELEKERMISMEIIRNYNSEITSNMEIKKVATKARNIILSDIITKEELKTRLERKIELNNLEPNNTYELKLEKQNTDRKYRTELLLLEDELTRLKEKELARYKEIEDAEIEVERISKELKEYYKNIV